MPNESLTLALLFSLALRSVAHPHTFSSRDIPKIFTIPDSDWQSLNVSVGGRLYAGTPFALPCYTTYENGTTTEPRIPDLGACSAVMQNKANTSFIGDQFGGYQNAEFGRCMSNGFGCALSSILPVDPFSPLLTTCHQGSVPNYYIDVREVSDIQKGLQFASAHDIPLVIKNSGHDYKGRSSGPNSLGLWVHNLQPQIRLDEQFTPESCPESVGPTLTYGAGQGFEGIFSFAHEHGYMAVGGTSATVCASGGWVAGGGHSALSPTHGLGVDNAMQMKVVLPNGTYITTNRCQNQEIFFALRGGGGGTFGVVTETTSRVYPEVPLQVADISFSSPFAGKEVTDLLIQNAAQWADDGWGGYIGSGAGLFTFMTAITPKLTLEEAKESLKPLLDYAANAAIPITANISTVPNYWAYFTSPGAQLLGGVTNSLSVAMSSRLIPRENFEGTANQQQLSDTLSSKLFGILMVTPAAYELPESDLPGGPGEASVTPAWRNSLWHILMQTAWDSADPNANSPAGMSQNFRDVSQSMQPVRDITPNGGAYQNEGDTFEPDPINSFWGSKNYDRLLALKREIDPKNLLTCHQCVGWEPSDERFSCYPQV